MRVGAFVLPAVVLGACASFGSAGTTAVAADAGTDAPLSDAGGDGLADGGASTFCPPSPAGVHCADFDDDGGVFPPPPWQADVVIAGDSVFDTSRAFATSGTVSAHSLLGAQPGPSGVTSARMYVSYPPGTFTTSHVAVSFHRGSLTIPGGAQASILEMAGLLDNGKYGGVVLSLEETGSLQLEYADEQPRVDASKYQNFRIDVGLSSYSSATGDAFFDDVVAYATP
jgi:hypothetical protein